ncbi:MAG: uroporphyrinogen decarboxylase [Alphaproteobacteria bacterium]|nr:uroporphyrinogen decarboxylase [Alphaproteobacteria bacterium]
MGVDVKAFEIRSGKPFLDVLYGQSSQRLPFWFMRQAGRYLPEYRALRADKGGFLAMALDPVAACEITMQPVRRFGMDAAIIFSDILTIPMALGRKLEFIAGEGPKLDALESMAEVANLDFSQFSKLEPVYEALRQTRSQLQKEGFSETALIGFCGAPWTVATYMIEGGSSRDFVKTKVMAYSDPEGFSALIELLVEASAQYLIEQVRAGAEALQIFDSWSGALDSDSFMRWCVRPMREIVTLVRAACPDVPIIGFPKGAGYNYQVYVQETGVNAVGLDSQIPVEWAARSLQNFVPVQGNLDPLCLLAGGDSMILAVEKILVTLGRGKFIFNLGHGIHKDTPVAHVEQLVAMIKNHKVGN